MSEPFVLEIRRGSGDPRYLTLESGQELPPLSIGTAADWRVDADGMDEVHAFVYFDGQQLHVQSAVPDHLVQVNGRVVGTEVHPVAPRAPSPVMRRASSMFLRAVPSPARAWRRCPAGTPRSTQDFADGGSARRQDDDEAVGQHRAAAGFDEEATRALPVPGAARMLG